MPSSSPRARLASLLAVTIALSSVACVDRTFVPSDVPRTDSVVLTDTVFRDTPRTDSGFFDSGFRPDAARDVPSVDTPTVDRPAPIDSPDARALDVLDAADTVDDLVAPPDVVARPDVVAPDVVAPDVVAPDTGPIGGPCTWCTFGTCASMFSDYSCLLNCLIDGHLDCRYTEGSAMPCTCVD